MEFSVAIYRTGKKYSLDLGETNGDYSGYLRSLRIGFLGRRMQLTLIPLRILKSKYIVVEHKLSDLSILLLLLFLPSRVILWGHGESLTTLDSSAISYVRILLARRARMYLAYTKEGAQYLIQNGVNSNSIRVLVNTLDTEDLLCAKHGLTSDAIKSFESKYKIKDKRVVAYVGALEPYKKLDLIIDAFELLSEENFDVICFFLGSGSQKQYLQKQNRHQFILLDRGNAEEKALLAHFAKCFVIPGRIGLIAIDSIYLERLILTTNWQFHAPEFRYLTSGRDVMVSESNPTEYAHCIKEIFVNHGLRESYEKNLRDLQTQYSGSNMVKNFLEALSSLESIS